MPKIILKWPMFHDVVQENKSGTFFVTRCRLHLAYVDKINYLDYFLPRSVKG